MDRLKIARPREDDIEPLKRRRVVDDKEETTDIVFVPSSPEEKCTVLTEDDYAIMIDNLIGLTEDEPCDFLLEDSASILKDEKAFICANVGTLWTDSYLSIKTGKNNNDEIIWMCGEVLNLYAFLLSRGREALISHLSSDVVVPFVYKDIMKENSNLEALRDQITRIGVAKYTFWPVLADDEHWILIVFEKGDNSSKDRAIFLDSLNRKKYFVDAQKKLEELRLLLCTPQWVKDCPLINVTSVKETKRHQHDGKNVPVHSCGAWVCLYMELIAKHVPIDFIVTYLNNLSAYHSKVGISNYEQLLQKRLITFVSDSEECKKEQEKTE
jgi:hypothetical protein